MGKIKKATSDRTISNRKKVKPLKRTANPAIKQHNQNKKKKHNLKDLRKHLNTHESLEMSRVKNERNNDKNPNSDNKSQNKTQMFQRNAVPHTNNNTTPSNMKKVKHKNRKFLLPLRERMLTQLKAARFR